MDPLPCYWKIVASFNKETKLPKETMFPLTRYNLGSSAVGWGRGGGCSWKCTPETFLFNQDSDYIATEFPLLRPYERNELGQIQQDSRINFAHSSGCTTQE